MAVLWGDHRDDWLFESIRVRRVPLVFVIGILNVFLFSDFFPVILTFLRQLPVIGHFLTLPYVRNVSFDGQTFSSTALTSVTGSGPLSGFTTVYSLTYIMHLGHSIISDVCTMHGTRSC